MNYINITVRGKIARAEEHARVVCGNSDYAVRFDFDEEWEAYDLKTARFITEGGFFTDVQFTGSDCAVPVLTGTRTLLVGVYAGNLRTTTAALIHALPCVTDPDGTPADPAPDVYSQLMERFNTMEAPDAVLYTEQELTEEQKAQARENIKAVGYEQFTIVNKYNEIASCGATSGVCRNWGNGSPDGLAYPAFFLFSSTLYGKRHVTMLDGAGQFWGGLANESDIQNMTIVRTIPDWAQNDETAADYIKNRPCYEDSSVQTICDTRISSVPLCFTLENPIKNGESYDVKIAGNVLNGVTCTELDTMLRLALGDYGIVIVRSPEAILQQAEYQGPFHEYERLEIMHAASEVKRLDAKFLPDKFIINLTFDDDGNAQADKIFEEIQEAYDEGRDIRLMMPGGGETFPMFAFVPNRSIAFSIGTTEFAQSVFISPSGVMITPQSFLPTASDDEPLPLGVASAGSDAAYARADHVHPKETLTVRVQKNSDGKYHFVTGTYADIKAAEAAGYVIFMHVMTGDTFGNIYFTCVHYSTIYLPGGSKWYLFRNLIDGNLIGQTICVRSDELIEEQPDGVANEIVLHSSTAGSVKTFKLTVDDNGAVTATEITD